MRLSGQKMWRGGKNRRFELAGLLTVDSSKTKTRTNK